MPRVNHVKSAKRDHGPCVTCYNVIQEGDAYKFMKFRLRPRGSLTRKWHETCAIRASQRTTSDKLSRIYSAQEDAEDAAGEWDGEDLGEANEILNNLAAEIREVSEEYREGAENIREHFSESSQADENEEKADELEGWADDLESGLDVDEFTFDDTDVKDEDKEEEEERQREEWISQVRDELIHKIGECPL
jgi:hypothetical protein